MSEVRLENSLSLLPWTNTREALSNLQELLKCNGCQQLPLSPQYMGRCDHFFCEFCMKKLTDNLCPICKIPSLPCERKPDIIVQGLVHSTKEMFDLINGGQVPMRNFSLEAPDPSCKSKRPLNNNSMNPVDALNCKSTVNKEIVFQLHSAKSASSTPNHIATVNDNFQKPKSTVKSLSHKSKSNENRTHVSKKNMKKETQTNSNNNNSCNSNKNIRTSSAYLKCKETDGSLCSEKNNKEIGTPVANTSVSKVQDLAVLGVQSISPGLNKRNFKGETPLHTACIKRDVTKVKKLLEEGANPNTRDNAGWTPLHEACSHGFEDIADLLLLHGALVDVPGNSNLTPLHDAVLTECLPVVALLRRWGASDTQRDIWGRTARSLAELTKDPVRIHSALDTPKDSISNTKLAPAPLQTKILILDSSLSADSKRKLEKLVKLLKVKSVTEFSGDVTHVVVGCGENKRVCPRTIKYMMGVVSGKWIVSQEWIDACLAHCGPVSPVEYEVRGPLSNPNCLAPNKGRSNASKMLPGLFSGCHVYFCGSFGDSLPTKKELEALIKAGDGIPMQREPNPESIDILEQTVPFHVAIDSPLAKCSHFCIYAESIHEPQLKYDMTHIKSLPLSWLYDCIDHWSLVSPVK